MLSALRGEEIMSKEKTMAFIDKSYREVAPDLPQDDGHYCGALDSVGTLLFDESRRNPEVECDEALLVKVIRPYCFGD